MQICRSILALRHRKKDHHHYCFKQFMIFWGCWFRLIDELAGTESWRFLSCKILCRDESQSIFINKYSVDVNIMYLLNIWYKIQKFCAPDIYEQWDTLLSHLLYHHYFIHHILLQNHQFSLLNTGNFAECYQIFWIPHCGFQNPWFIRMNP